MGLIDRADDPVGALPSGAQRRLEIARALRTRPLLPLLDEPSLGLAPMVVGQIFAAIRVHNRDRGVTVLLLEQNAYHALRLAHRGYVLVNGTITMRGAGAELLARQGGGLPISRGDEPKAGRRRGSEASSRSPKRSAFVTLL